MLKFRRKQKPEEQVIDTASPEAIVNRLDDEPATSAPPTLHMSAWMRSREPEAIHTEFQMTIQPKVSNLTAREASMLLMVCNVQALRDGIDLTLYLSMEYLLNRLTRSGSKAPSELKDERQRQTALLAHLILGTFRGNWNSLGERLQILDEEVFQAIANSNWLPDKRTYNSWVQHWQPDRWLEVRIVPLEFLLERSAYSEPYSSYCKGYGEGTSRGALSTPYDSELDGESYADPEPPEFNLLEVQAYQQIHSAIEANLARRIQGR
jgi:hypothetical protein